MKTKITLVVEDGLDDKEQEMLRQLLRDAVGEFVSARGPTTETYVRRRYKLDGKAFAIKVAEVDGRKALAQKLRVAVDDVLVDEIDDE